MGDMQEPNTPPSFPVLRALFIAARPFSLLAGILLYAVGGGISVYLGELLDWSTYWIGQAAVTMLQLSTFLLSAYFAQPGRPPFEMRTRPGSRAPATPPRGIYLQVAATTLTVGAVMTVLLLARGVLSPAAFLFLALAVALGLLYAVPPFRLVEKGYGELVLAVLFANLIPSLAYVLQSGDPHRLLAMLTFPLTCLYLAAAIAGTLQSYAEDVRVGRMTMLVRIGWQRGMNLHNLLIATAYILLALAVIFKLPWRLAYPVFLSLPVALFQIYQMSAIANGAKPRWRLLFYTSMATVGLAAYFMNLALWIG
jgi:1,4-dihydroxy-2-naphthoate octaprenyltransferase